MALRSRAGKNPYREAVEPRYGRDLDIELAQQLAVPAGVLWSIECRDGIAGGVVFQ